MSAVKSSRLRSRVTVCAAVAGCALAAASSASASTLAVDSGGTLRFTAARGEANAVNATDLSSPGTMVVTDTGSHIRVGNGCVAVTWHEGQCAVANDQDVVIDLGDRDDSARAFALTALRRLRMAGGSGDDTITTSGIAVVSVLNGGFGRDAITARPDRAEEIDGGSGADVIDGGGGGDTIDCGFGFDRYAVYDGDAQTSCELGFIPAAPA